MAKGLGRRAWRDFYVHPCKWEQSFAPLTMPELLAVSVAKFPNRALASFHGRTFTYQQIEHQARRFASGLQSLGLNKGDRIGLYLPNIPAYLSAYFGGMMAGLIIVPFSCDATQDELAQQVSDTGTRLLVTVDMPERLQAALKIRQDTSLDWLVVIRFSTQLPMGQGLAHRFLRFTNRVIIQDYSNVFDWSELQLDPVTPAQKIDPDHDTALLHYTTERHGVRRAAMFSHQNLTAGARQVAAISPHSHRRDITLGVLPLGHSLAGACALNFTIFKGGMIVLLPDFKTGQVLATIERMKVTTMPGEPLMFQDMLDHPRMSQTDFSSLFTCISEALPQNGRIKAALFQKVSGAKLAECYTGPAIAGLAASNPFDGRMVKGAVGHPLPSTGIRILDKMDPGLEAFPGQPGELAIAGPQVMQGYWQDSDSHNMIQHDGQKWLRTGDMARIGEDGYIRVLGRLDGKTAN